MCLHATWCFSLQNDVGFALTGPALHVAAWDADRRSHLQIGRRWDWTAARPLLSGQLSREDPIDARTAWSSPGWPPRFWAGYGPGKGTDLGVPFTHLGCATARIIGIGETPYSSFSPGEIEIVGGALPAIIFADGITSALEPGNQA